MKLFVAVTILLACYLGSEYAVGDTFGVICEPNKVFLDSQGCNNCTCSANGTSAACTKKSCPTPMPVPIGQRPCTPNTIFQAGTVVCQCSKDGNVDACVRPATPECTPGQRMPLDCNNCTCNEAGVFFCTKKNCLRQRRHKKRCKRCHSSEEISIRIKIHGK